jgi:hypothetical protein
MQIWVAAGARMKSSGVSSVSCTHLYQCFAALPEAKGSSDME